MPSMDFGTPNTYEYSDDDVSISSLPFNSNKDFISLSLSNKSDLDIHTIKEPNIKVIESFGIYKNRSPVGEISIWSELDGEIIIPSLSYWVDKNHRNLGIAYKAVGMTIKHCFNTLNYEQVRAHATVDNHASKGLLAKYNFGTIFYTELKTKNGPKLFAVYELIRSDNKNANL